ncbi:CsiV family protein [sulfur-oxidizing endosymbiont of Gigantopelta aegis]|uniref:CsiV family protein n=1 Tax=sulfur-oxidizing endosymbiont of Gigantopelta aegis TaxID=2794934 RepID=UPI0018DDA59F|nr:CsiV family protein [sulfur-oxidizing endosymbiont of Gigantopelta aegis]
MHILLKYGRYLLLLLCASTSLQAEETANTDVATEKKQYYIVEVILFQHLNEQGKRDERWSRPDLFDGTFNDNTNESSLNKNIGTAQTITDNQTLTDDSPALAEYDLQNKRFLALRNDIAAISAENYKLAESAAHLRYSPNFKLLAHFGWTQRSLSKHQALPIKIISNQFSDSLIPSGEIKLYVSRFLHMQVDLKASRCEYSSEQTSPTIEKASDAALDKQLENGTSQLETQNTDAINDNNSCTNQVYLFKQNRKMRSRELHYIDNPVFGLLVYVTPFTSGGETQQQQQQQQQ